MPTRSKIGEKPYSGPSYTAIRVRPADPATGSNVKIIAIGENNRAGYHTYLRMDPEPGFVPKVSFVNLPPQSESEEVLTPFSVDFGLKILDSMKTVVVVDTLGAHQVAVSE